MVDFKFTKSNGIAVVGVTVKVTPHQAKVYQKLGLGSVVSKNEPKKELKKTKKNSKK